MKRQTDPYDKTKKYIFKQIAQKLTQVFPCPRVWSSQQKKGAECEGADDSTLGQCEELNETL